MIPRGVKERPILFSAPMVRAILEGGKTQTRRIVKPQPPPVVSIYRPYSNDPNNWQGYRGGSRGGVINWYGSCPYGVEGYRLWVRETWAFARHSTDYETGGEYSVWEWDTDVFGPYDPAYLSADTRGAMCAAALFYRADGEDNLPAEFSMSHGSEIRWKPSIHMPRWSSRILLEITDVRVQRLQDISEEDARAEGVNGGCTNCGETPCAKDCFIHMPDYRDGFAGIWHEINGEESWNLNPWVWAITFKRIETAERAA